MTTFAYEVRWSVADRDANLIGDIAGRDGTIVWDGQARIQRAARGVSFDSSDWSSVNPLTDWLVPRFVRQDGTSVRLGHFTAADVPRRWRTSSVTYDPQPYLTDGGALLQNPSPYVLAGSEGEAISDAIARVVEVAGIYRYNIESAGNVLGEPVAYPAGTTYTEALTGLADLAGFLPPYFDRDGVLVLRSVPTGSPLPDVVYDGASIVRDTRVEDDDLLSAPNTFVVLGAGASDGPIVAVSELPPSAPNSVANRAGRRITKVVREQGIDTVDQAERLAALVAATAVRQFQRVTFGSLANPVHDGFTVVQVNGAVLLEHRWDLPLDVGQVMTHEVSTIAEVSS